MVKLRILEGVGGADDYPELSDESNIIIRVLVRGKQEGQSQRRRYDNEN